VEATGAAATAAAGLAAAAFLDFSATGAATAAAALTATAATSATGASDFLETFLAGAEADLLIVLVAEEVFDMVERGYDYYDGKRFVKFYVNRGPKCRKDPPLRFFLLKCPDLDGITACIFSY
jgi:hypothetical protein